MKRSTQIGPLVGRSPMPTDLFGPVDVVGAYILPPIGNVFFVRGNSSGQVPNLDDQYTATNPRSQRCFPSVKSVLASGKCVAGRGDTIVCLPGHVENIDAADCWDWVAGVRIIGLGDEYSRPTFTFTLATSTLLLNVNGLSIENCRFLCAGPAGTTALTVAAPFTLSGHGCSLIGNYLQVGIDADQIVGAAITITGDYCSIIGNKIDTLAVAAEITDVIVLTGADHVRIEDNEMKATVGVAQGLIRSVTTASTNVSIRRNFIYSWKASSTSCINFAAALANTGIIADNRLRVTTDGGVAHIGTNAAGDLSLYENYGVNNVNETGILVGTPSA